VIVQGTSVELDVARARGIRDELAAAQAEIARLREEPGIRRASRPPGLPLLVPLGASAG
jgi:hypothetical protein